MGGEDGASIKASNRALDIQIIKTSRLLYPAIFCAYSCCGARNRELMGISHRVSVLKLALR
jgi:hypothetical protein